MKSGISVIGARASALAGPGRTYGCDSRAARRYAFINETGGFDVHVSGEPIGRIDVMERLASLAAGIAVGVLTLVHA